MSQDDPTPTVPLSVLDLAPVSEGSTSAEALAHSLELVQQAERLGYHRYWVAEHHNMPGVASSAPAVLIAHLASVTSSLRVGSGGVMLPNHAPLTVAEQFGMLEALHPGRIDLGLGRAPGTDLQTARALRRRVDVGAEDFTAELAELLHHFDGHFPADHPSRGITAVPARGNRPAIWLLGSSDYSATLAGHLGLPFSFAHHFAGGNTLAALDAYRRAFRPSAELESPYVMLGVNVVCAPDDDEARFLAGSGALAMLRLRTGRPGPFPSPETAAAYAYSPMEREFVAGWTSTQVVGSPATVRAGLEDLVERTHADELMITTNVHAHEARLRSYELVAAVCRPAAARPLALGAA